MILPEAQGGQPGPGQGDQPKTMIGTAAGGAPPPSPGAYSYQPPRHEQRTVMTPGTGGKPQPPPPPRPGSAGGPPPPRAPMIGSGRTKAGQTRILDDGDTPSPYAPPPAATYTPPAASQPPPPMVASGSIGGDLSEDLDEVSNLSALSSLTDSLTPSGVTNVGSVTMPTVGSRIAHYEVIRELGAGGMGTVYLARDLKLGRRVAIKFLQTRHPELTQRFILEARATARCQHENIVIIYEVDAFQGSPYMVLEFLQGQPLNKLTEHGQKMAPQRVVEIMTSVVRALACAHEQGIAHRDLKPENIFVTESGTIKVLDFGIAKVLQEKGGRAQAAPQNKFALAAGVLAEEEGKTGGGSQLTRHGAIMGTLQYMSPEQWGIGIEIDHRTDIWAVGIMLFKMLSGRHPLEELRGEQLIVTAMLDQPMPKLADVCPDLPAGLAAVVDRCLLKRKEERFPDARSLMLALEPFQPGRYQGKALSIEESPYAGLASFQENDAGRFYGRNREIAAMVMRIRDRPLMAVVGPSGVGKSSFVRAGLVPGLKNSGEKWETLVIRPGRNPLQALASVLGNMVGTSNTLTDDLAQQDALAQRLAVEPGYVGNALRSRARREGTHILLFVDQFEELYTLVQDPRERLAFTACLSGAADDPTSPMRVVVSVRSDFLDRAAEDSHFMNELSQGLFFLPPPSREGQRDAIQQPAEMVGYRFEDPAIIEEMLDHLATTSGALPLLQFTAAKLWESRDPARKMLTVNSYRQIGGIAGALAMHADRVLQKLNQQQLALAKDLMLRLVTGERTRAIVSIDELRELSKDAAEVQHLIDHLVQARLLVVQTGGGATGATVEIVHESLISNWATLRRWLDESGEDAVFLEQLRNASKAWASKGKDRDLVWRGELADEGVRFQKRYRGELPQQQREFLNAIVDLQRRGVRVKRMAIVGSGIFAGLLLAAAAVALVIISSARKDAIKNADVAKKAEVTAKEAAKAAKAAEAEAKKNLAAAEEKEQQRLAEEEAKKAAEAEVAARNAELAVKNADLASALDKAEEAREHAKKEQGNAEANAKAAQAAKAEALRAAKELELTLKKEQERVARLQRQLGSPVIEDLVKKDNKKDVPR
jgi:eukaryotic-like serine/threonine-protein kinase